MLWAHAIVTMGKEGDDAGLTEPLGLTRSNERVKVDLRTVKEVTKLRLPDDLRGM